MAFGPADRDGTNQNKDRTWKGPSVKLWVTAPAATFPIIAGQSNRHNHYQRQIDKTTDAREHNATNVVSHFH